MVPWNLIRIGAVAIGLSTLSFAAGVAGDLSVAVTPNFGERVVLRLPPELPADTVRAAPLPPLVRISAVQGESARPPAFTPIRVARIEVEHMVSDSVGIALTRLPKLSPIRLGKPQIRVKPA